MGPSSPTALSGSSWDPVPDLFPTRMGTSRQEGVQGVQTNTVRACPGLVVTQQMVPSAHGCSAHASHEEEGRACLKGAQAEIQAPRRPAVTLQAPLKAGQPRRPAACVSVPSMACCPAAASGTCPEPLHWLEASDKNVEISGYISFPNTCLSPREMRSEFPAIRYLMPFSLGTSRSLVATNLGAGAFGGARSK